MNKEWRVPARALNKSIACEWQLVCWKQLCWCHFQVLLMTVVRWPISFKIDRNTDIVSYVKHWRQAQCILRMASISFSVHPQEDKIVPWMWGFQCARDTTLLTKWSGAWNLCTCFADQIWLQIPVTLKSLRIIFLHLAKALKSIVWPPLYEVVGFCQIKCCFLTLSLEQLKHSKT